MIVNINRYKIYPLVFISRPKCLQLFTCVRRMRELCSISLVENKMKVWALWHLTWTSYIIERMFPLWVRFWRQYSLLLQYWILEKLVTCFIYEFFFLLIVPSSTVFNVFLYSGTADNQPHKIPLGKYF